MTKIRIDNTGDGTWWLYGNSNSWKDYVCCEDFDEQVVLTGNKDLVGCTEAKWYKKAKEILNNIDYYDEYPTDVSDDVNVKLKKMYDKCKCIEDILVDTIKLLYPKDTFKTGTIEGYSQGDWQDYIVKGDVDTDLLEAMYFRKIADVNVTTNEEEFGDVITRDELWRAEREEGLKEFFRKHYDLDKDEEIHILQANDYKKVVDWKEIA